MPVSSPTVSSTTPSACGSQAPMGPTSPSAAIQHCSVKPGSTATRSLSRADSPRAARMQGKIVSRNKAPMASAAGAHPPSAALTSSWASRRGAPKSACQTSSGKSPRGKRPNVAAQSTTSKISASAGRSLSVPADKPRTSSTSIARSCALSMAALPPLLVSWSSPSKRRSGSAMRNCSCAAILMSTRRICPCPLGLRKPPINARAASSARRPGA
mmetsp:Transcript_54291/g.151094  ORF Transcript_54291/g.151094 Transcript_54291/m.151094 type:complete len:214 (-) Transcript_54291:443-1084(-)